MTFDEMTKSFAEKLDKGGEKAKEILESGADKAALLAELTKYNFAVSRETKTAEKLYAEIGRAYCSHADPQRLAQLKTKVEQCNANIASMEKKCDELRIKAYGKGSTGAGEKLCVRCGAVNKSDDGFCVSCGEKLV